MKNITLPKITKIICPRCGGKLISDFSDIACLRCGWRISANPTPIIPSKHRRRLFRRPVRITTEEKDRPWTRTASFKTVIQILPGAEKQKSGRFYKGNRRKNELAVKRLSDKGLSLREIADKLDLSYQTVKNYRHYPSITERRY